MQKLEHLIILGFVLVIAAKSSPADTVRVLCFGDSITAKGEWVEEVGNHVSIETINAGRSGRKASQASEELALYLDQYPELDKIILFLGVNDLPARDPRPADVKVASCVSDMDAAISLALNRFKNTDVILVSPCNVNTDTMNDINKAKGYNIVPQMLKNLEKQYEGLARDKDVLFLSLLNVVSKENFKDGLHPNGNGDAEIAKAILDFLTKESEPAEDSAGPKMKTTPNGWPEEVRSILYPATIDKSQQPMLLREAKSLEKRPLLVGLHTWSGDYTQGGGELVYARWCIEKDWYFIHPNFRGPNWTADACGSEKVVQDVIDAVEYMKNNYNVDNERIYLVGVSGGGHAACLIAGRSPGIWGGVSAWVPITDIGAWWEQKRTGKDSQYADHIEKAVGGRPDEKQGAVRECIKRSPITYLSDAYGVNLDINAGVTDGHQGGSVPFKHSLYAYNKVVPEKDRLSTEFIEAFYEAQALPEGTEKSVPDPLYGEKEVVFRKVSNNTRVTIFDGRHEIIHHAALNWLAQQRKGKPANWNVTEVHNLKVKRTESESGK